MIKKYFSSAADNNTIMLLMYYLAWPFVIFFEKLKISPNLVSVFSLLLSSLSFLYLIYLDNLNYFFLSFFFSLLLDYVDGTLARKTNKLTKNLDHNFDIIRIVIIHLGLILKFNEIEIFFYSLVSLTLFLIHNFILSRKIKKNKSIIKNKHPLIRERISFIKPILHVVYLGKTLKFFYRFFTTLQGQAVLLFIISPINLFYCKIVLFYFSFVCFYSLMKILFINK